MVWEAELQVQGLLNAQLSNLWRLPLKGIKCVHLCGNAAMEWEVLGLSILISKHRDLIFSKHLVKSRHCLG